MSLKMSPEYSSVVCDGYVRYEGEEFDRSAIMQDYSNNEKKRIKKTAIRPFYFLFLHLSRVIVLGPGAEFLRFSTNWGD